MATDPQIILTAIQNAGYKQKQINSSLKKCLKKLSFRSSADLENLANLAHWLYVFGYNDDALRATGIVDDIKFAGNFDLWSPIETLLLLQARILRLQNEKARAKLAKQKVTDAMVGHEEALQRRLSFDWLNDDSIARYVKEGNQREANVGRFADLSSLIFIRELGEGKTDLEGKPADVAGAETRIAEYLEILQSVR